MKAQHHIKVEQLGSFVRSVLGEGEVVSVHSRAINIRCPQGLLVSIVEEASQMTSLSMSAPSLFQHRGIRETSIRPGCAVHLDKEIILIDGMCIDPEGGETWDGIIRSRHVRGFSLENLCFLKEALLLKGKKEGLLGIAGGGGNGNPFVRLALERLGAMRFDGRNQHRIRGLSQLVGLGPGFTPSGDDFITGVLAGERVCQVLWGAVHPVSEIDKEELRESLPKTNDAGRTLLWQALKGRFPAYMTEAVKGFAGARGPNETREAVSSAVDHGETSGTDALAGLVWYLETQTSLAGSWERKPSS